ncbi:MAG TPA: TetR/AcrR family transcriptional regulator [Mycobacteriales bacterium]|nr:TetR/AcrR family transcriptional regulator [Mycobacteriales bacterium]
MSPRPYRMGARTASVADTRERVVTAARALFADAGFHRVSLEEIARRADVARATVYHQFGSKLGVLGAVVEDFERRAGLAALADLVETAPPDRLVRDVVTAGCAYWATDPALARSIIAFAVADPAAADLLAGHDAGRLRLLTRLVARLPGPVPPAALDTLWLLTGFAAYDDLTRGRGLSTAAAATLLAELAQAGLRT